MSQQKYLIFSPWNNGTGNAHCAKMYTKEYLSDQHQVVVLGSKREEWVEEFTPPSVENFRFHEFGEQLSVGGEIFENPGLEPTDYVVCQIMVYAKEYDIDNLVLIGGFYELFEILARLRVITENDPFLLRKNICVIVRNKFKRIVDTEERHRLAYNSDRRFPSWTISSNVEIEGINSDPYVFKRSFPPQRDITQARLDLESSMGFRFPKDAFIILTCNPNYEQLERILQAFQRFMENRDPQLVKKDYFFLFVQDSGFNYDKAGLVQNHAFSDYIVVGRFHVPSCVLVDLYDSCNIGIHTSTECRLEHDSRRRHQVFPRKSELVIRNLVYDVPDVESSLEQFENYYSQLINH